MNNNTYYLLWSNAVWVIWSISLMGLDEYRKQFPQGSQRHLLLFLTLFFIKILQRAHQPTTPGQQKKKERKERSVVCKYCTCLFMTKWRRKNLTPFQQDYKTHMPYKWKHVQTFAYWSLGSGSERQAASFCAGSLALIQPWQKSHVGVWTADNLIPVNILKRKRFTVRHKQVYYLPVFALFVVGQPVYTDI